MTSTKLLSIASVIAFIAAFSSDANAGGCEVEILNANSPTCPAACTNDVLTCGDIRDNAECVKNIKKQLAFLANKAVECRKCDVVAKCQL